MFKIFVSVRIESEKNQTLLFRTITIPFSNDTELFKLCFCAEMSLFEYYEQSLEVVFSQTSDKFTGRLRKWNKKQLSLLPKRRGPHVLMSGDLVGYLDALM